tara:strand:+ start:420 stop:956 length:537 start_codon:yes stop_codon:yes gene_type:complete
MSKKLKPFTLWLTGISASGKTTLAKKIIEKLNMHDSLSEFLLVDGDEIRNTMSFYQYNNIGREKIGLLKAEMAEEENKKGKNVIVTGIAAKAKWRKDYRKIIENYYEVYLCCSLEACVKRDYKNQYKKAIDGDIGNFGGVTDDYEEHDEVDLKINTETSTIEKSTIILFNFIQTIKSH